MNAHEFANRAGELLEDRGKERDQPNGERSMARCVSAFNAMTGHDLSTEDGWLFMVYLKHARMRGGAFRLDDYEDAVSYEALMAEEAVQQDETDQLPLADVEYLNDDECLLVSDIYPFFKSAKDLADEATGSYDY